MISAHHSSVVMTVFRCTTGCSSVTGFVVISVVAEVSGATSHGESWLRLGMEPLEFCLVGCVCTVAGAGELDDSCNTHQQSWAQPSAHPLCRAHYSRTVLYIRGGQLFWLGGHFVEAEVGGGPHILKWLHSLVNFAFQKRYKLYHKNQ
jgi:hypothetical protein